MDELPGYSTIEEDGWILLSSEERAAAFPETFEIPSRASRESLLPGQAAQLLFDIETREGGRIVDRGVDRMWVIVKARTEWGYVGVLDSNPGEAETLKLHERDLIAFAPEHVASIDQPPHDYVVGKYGVAFFDQQ